mmetsp:Transcript_15704/g.26753  ORF Transcript_15704/g.26753 Transcript_15704/m.26753 type:complete len:99 (+) Transcript_15704:359-655(+)
MYRIGRATKKNLGSSNQQNEMIKETTDERNVEGGMKRDLWSANDGYLKECMAGELGFLHVEEQALQPNYDCIRRSLNAQRMTHKVGTIILCCRVSTAL